MIIILIAGFLLSLYALYLERRITRNKEYAPVCDISNRISCTKPIMSGYGKIFGLSNAFLGLIFYTSMIIVLFLGYAKLLFWGALGACVASVYFAYVLFLKIRVFCVVCVALYVVNALLLWCAYNAL